MAGSGPKIRGGKYTTPADYERYMRDAQKLLSPYGTMNTDSNFTLQNNNDFGSDSDADADAFDNNIDKNNIRYAENNFANTATDGTYPSNSNNISDEDLYARMRDNIAEFEELIEYPYLDSKGYITTGYGSNVNHKDDFMKVPFTIQGRPATDDEKDEYYRKLTDMSSLVDQNYNYVHHNKKAKAFEQETPLRISQDNALNTAQQHMNNDLAQVRREFSDFDNFPLPLKEVLLDIQYNVKGGLQRKNWPHLYDAIERKDVSGEDGIVANVHRKDVGKKRNDWAERMARLIRF